MVLLSIGGFGESSGIEIGLILAEAIQRRGEFAEQLGLVCKLRFNRHQTRGAALDERSKSLGAALNL